MMTKRTMVLEVGWEKQFLSAIVLGTVYKKHMRVAVMCEESGCEAYPVF